MKLANEKLKSAKWSKS